MLKENLISVSIPPETITKVLACLTTIQDELKPYLIALTPVERRTILKMNDKTIPFVQKVIEYAAQFPQFVPVYLNISELHTDMKATQDLSEIFRPLEAIFDGVSDTTMLAGSESYAAALAYYNSVKQAAKMNVPAAKGIYDDLSKRFPGKTKKLTEPTE